MHTHDIVRPPRTPAPALSALVCVFIFPPVSEKIGKSAEKADMKPPGSHHQQRNLPAHQFSMRKKTVKMFLSGKNHHMHAKQTHVFYLIYIYMGLDIYISNRKRVYV